MTIPAADPAPIDTVSFNVRTEREWLHDLAEHAAMWASSDIRAHTRPAWSWRPYLRRLAITGLVVIIAGPLIGFAILAILYWREYIVAVVVAIALAALILSQIRRLQVKRILAQQIPVRDVHVRIGPDGISEGDASPPRAWSTVERAEICSHGLLLRLAERRCMWLPASALTSGTIEDVRTIVARHAQRVWMRVHPPESKAREGTA